MMPYLLPKLVSGEKQDMKLYHSFKFNKSLKANLVTQVVSSSLSFGKKMSGSNPEELVFGRRLACW